MKILHYQWVNALTTLHMEEQIMARKQKIIISLVVSLAVIGLVFSSPAWAKVEGDTIIFGAALSFTGKYSTNGKHTKNGYELAVKRINEKGGLKVGGKSYKIAIKYYDDESTPARSGQLADRLIKQDDIKFILGPYGSGPTKGIAPITEKYKIPMVEGNGASRSLFNKGYKYIFAVLSTSEQYLAESINLLAEQFKADGKDPKTAKVAIAVENDPFSMDIRAGVVEDAKRWGMKVVIDDKLPKELTDMTATLTKVKALRPDALIVSGHSKGAALAVRQTAQMKVDVPMLAITHCEAADVIGKFGGDANYTLCATQWAETMTYQDEYFGFAGDYYIDFKKEYGYAPPYQAAESTAAVMVYADALQRANSFDTEKVRDALAATNIETFYGRVKFDETGKNIAKPMVLRQIQKGKLVPVAPSKFASGELIFPKPKWKDR
jgi:branched-chain amino acid transport system substrate-binding protein